MPRYSRSVPKYRRHQHSGQAICTINARDYYRDPYGTAASHAEYDRLIGEWLASGRSAAFGLPTEEFTVVELLAAYLKYARRYYGSGPRGEYANMKRAIKRLKELYGRSPAGSFGPLELKAVRQRLIYGGGSRTYVNAVVRRIVRVAGWVITPVEIDDVPIVTLTLTGADSYTLRRIGEEAVERLTAVPEVSRAYVVGGERRTARVEFDAERLRGYSVSPLEIERAIRGANVTLPAGEFTRKDTVFRVDVGVGLARPEDLAGLVVGVSGDRPVFLKDVATVRDGPAEIVTYVRHGWGPGRGFAAHHGSPGTERAIRLTVLGVMPGFWLLNHLTGQTVGGYADPVFFTATAMIGMIALAGIVTRDSIILVDFIQLARKQGRTMFDAILESRVVRLRPILLTAGAAMLSSVPITLDPIFSGLGWSLIFGLFASTVFTMFVIPVCYWFVYGRYDRHNNAAGLDS